MFFYTVDWLGSGTESAEPAASLLGLPRCPGLTLSMTAGSGSKWRAHATIWQPTLHGLVPGHGLMVGNLSFMGLGLDLMIHEVCRAGMGPCCMWLAGPVCGPSLVRGPALGHSSSL